MTWDAKLTFNQAEIEPAVVIHDFPFYSGSTPTDHLVGHWKCNDDSASTTIIDETGNYNGTLAGGDNTEDISSTDAVRGTSLLLNGTDDYLDLSSAISALSDDAKFTVIIKYKPNFSYTGSGFPPLFQIDAGGNDYLVPYYHWGNSQWRFGHVINSSSDSEILKTFTSNEDFQQWRTCILSVNLNEGCIYLDMGIGNEYITFISGLGTWSATLNRFTMGHDNYVAGAYGAFYFDEIKLLDGCILPFGCIPTQYNQVGDYSQAHDDITLNAECESTSLEIPNGSSITLAGSTQPDFDSTYKIDGTYSLRKNSYFEQAYITVTSGDMIDFTDFSFSCWMLPISITTSYTFLSIYDTSTSEDAISLLTHYSDATRIRPWIYQGSTAQEQTNPPTGTIVANVWNHFVMRYKVDEFFQLVWNGVPVVTTTSGFTGTWGGDGSGTIRLFGEGTQTFSYDKIQVGKCYTPQGWTNFGKELWTPQMKYNGSLIQVGA